MPFNASFTGSISSRGRFLSRRGTLIGDQNSSFLQLAMPLGGSWGLRDYSADIKGSGVNKTTSVVRGAGASLDQSKFYESSLFMGTIGARNTLTIANNSSMHLTNQNFTIEGWFYFTQNNVGYQALASHAGDTGDQQNGWLLLLESNSTLTFVASAGGGWQITVASSYVPPTNQWIHVSVTRSSNVTRLFVDGTQVSSSSAVVNIASPTTREFRLGNYLWFPGGERGFSGYIQDFRMYVGLAKYTSNFVPDSYGIASSSSTTLGLSSTNPATSLADLRASGITGDGVYWLSTPQNPAPFRTFCKFNYIDGGDWALILKVHNRGDMTSGNALWRNEVTNNVSDFNLYGSSTFSKYNSWNGIRFNRVMMDMGGRIPPIMVFNTQRTFAEAVTAAGNPANGSGLPADSTDPAFGAGAGHDYSNSSQFPMKLGANFSRQAGGLEWYIQRYGIGSWANGSQNSTTSVDGFSSTGIAGAWVGAPLDEGTHTFNAVSNAGADSGFGFGATAGNSARTTSAGYIEWQSGVTSDTLPGFLWVR